MLEDRAPAEFERLLADVIAFSDPIIERDEAGLIWDPTIQSWS